MSALALGLYRTNKTMPNVWLGTSVALVYYQPDVRRVRIELGRLRSQPIPAVGKSYHYIRQPEILLISI